MDPLSFSAALVTQRFGRPVEVHDRLESTNLTAAERARAGAPEGAAVVALEQSGGRGRRGRSWISPPGAGLYVSFVLRPTLPPAQASLLTIAAGVALRCAAEALCPGAELRTKWPNDLLAEGGPEHRKKLGGILMELSARPGQIDHAIVGLGLNLGVAPLPPEVGQRATSLEAHAGQRPSVPLAFARLAEALEQWMEAVHDPPRLLEAYAARAAGLGELVELGLEEGPIVGRLRGFDAAGGLRIEREGQERTYFAGDLWLPGMPR